jgi:hypothetical protein
MMQNVIFRRELIRSPESRPHSKRSRPKVNSIRREPLVELSLKYIAERSRIVERFETRLDLGRSDAEPHDRWYVLCPRATTTLLCSPREEWRKGSTVAAPERSHSKRRAHLMP